MHRLTEILLLASLLLPGLASAQLPPNPDFLDGASSHTYKWVDNITLRLHVFQPHVDASEPRAAIVFFFGGGWSSGSVRQFVPQAEYLANRGMVAVIADYRVFFRHGSSVSDAVADAKSAIRWVRSHAGELGIDPDRIAAAGGSAGGHLAAATAALADFESAGENLAVSSRPDALVLFNPAVDTARIGADRPLQFQGAGEALSPYHQAGGGFVPTLIQHGQDDATVPYSDVTAFCDKLTRLAGDCTLIGYAGAGHGFYNKGQASDRWYGPTVAEMDRFLTRLGYLPAP
ncbi:MAG: alpha/beta hydrolase [Gammaproteobacteria bacterium]|nr:alpha/beta hydrolase [Pseudomonadales bacterium]MCP5347456.1 alpha/beta hydrolase [Pseudomonadales bacterium]